MNKYETIMLISNKKTKEQIDNVITKFKNLISKNGVIESTEDTGERKLAYEIKNHTHAYYYIINFMSAPEFISELERNYRITDEILKFITVREDE